MCGIAGLYNYKPAHAVDRDCLQRMNEQLRHRGPDDEGFFVEGNIGLAMRRLSVIDLASGHQPMISDDGRVVIVFNGEIYNFQSLREDLIKKGIHFKTQSDTEVILRLYQQHGIDCVKLLRGMFAFSIWDAQHKRLLLARDRIGKKPVYYWVSNGRMAWSSELRSLLEVSDISRDIDIEALDLYLGLQYIPSPKSIFRAVKKLPPGHRLILEKGQLNIDRYWDLSFDHSLIAPSLEEAKFQIRERLLESTRLRMISDVPLGAFLSGGIDSSIVVGLMSQLADRPVKTFSIGFEEEDFSELPYARQVARHFGTDHTEVIVKPNMTDVLPSLAAFYGEPFGDSSALPSYYLAQETRKHVTVALTGDGGDESFGGYHRYVAMRLMDHAMMIPSAVRQTIASLARRIAFPVDGRPWLRAAHRFFSDVINAPDEDRYCSVIGIFSESQKATMYQQSFKEQLKQDHAVTSAQYYGAAFKRAESLDPVNRLLYVDMNTYLPECLMTKLDIATMAHSLEARSPLLDHTVIEYVFQLPGDWKLKNGRIKKWILKETFKNDLPPGILDRRKMGFGLPLGPWFRGPLKNYWRDVVLSSDAFGKAYFEPNALQSLFDEHLTGRRDHGYRMWVLLMLELWQENVLKGNISFKGQGHS